MKEKIMDWYIRHFIIDKAITYDKPGFVITKFNSPKGKVFQREVFFPESLLSQLETAIVNKFSEKGRQLEYDIGKTLGFNFAKIFKSPELKTDSPENVKKYIEFVIKYNFSTWAEDMVILEINVNEKSLKLQAKQHIICRQNGIGHILTEGAEAGFASYVFSDENVEVSQVKCQGRGDDDCINIIGPRDKLAKESINFRNGEILYHMEEDIRDKKFNDISKTTYSKESMYSVIKKGIFSYKDGKITYQGERYFDSGIITYYLIEYGLQRLQGAKDILYDVSFNFGKKIGLDKNKEHIVNYLSALGWGDILFALKTDEEFVHIDYFPWCPLESEIEQYSLIAGLVSGLMSSLLKKDIRLKNTIKATNTIQNKFSLTIK